MYQPRQQDHLDQQTGPQEVSLTRLDLPLRDVLVLVLRLNLAQLLAVVLWALVFGLPLYLLAALMGVE